MRTAFVLTCLTIFTSVTTFGQSFVGKNKLYKQGDKNYTEPEALSSQLYSNSIGKIVFSSKPIDLSGAETQLSNTFNLGDNIYCVALLETCLPNYKLFDNSGLTEKKSDGWFVRAYIDNPGGPSDDNFYLHSKYVVENKKYISFQLGKTEGDKSDFAKFNEALNKLADGTHKIKLVMHGSFSGSEMPKYPVAIGEITLNKKAGSTVKLGGGFKDVEANMTDEKIEAAALKAITKYSEQKKTDNYTRSGVTNGRWPLAKQEVKILNDDWQIENKNGGIVGRYLQVAVLVKNIRDGNCMILVYLVEQMRNTTGYQEDFQIVEEQNIDLFPKIINYKADCD